MYFFSVTSNLIRYTNQIDVLYVPSSMPSGYMYPNGANWSLPTQKKKILSFILSPGLMKLFGFKSQSLFPPSQTVTTIKNIGFLSDTYLVLSQEFAYTLGCNWVNSPFSEDPQTFYTILLKEAIGKLLEAEVSDSSMITVFPRPYTTLDIYTMDRDLNPMILIDPEISITSVLEYDEY